ncbi:MAG: VanZ family protein [Firmicutes bacterium]|nr:VanZ family protein [Bacillota bacterium]
MNEKKKYWVVALIVGMTVFIWSNSLVGRENSAQMSGDLVAWLEGLLNTEISELFIRKVAHFCEYAVLGFLYGIKFRQGRRNGQWIYNYGMAGLATAVADESIQILSGRGPMVADVLLDFCSFATGFAVLQALAWLMQRWKRA